MGLCHTTKLKKPEDFLMVVDKTLTPSPWTTLMDYPNGLPKWTTLKWTTPKNSISDYILTLHDLRGLQPPF